MPKGPNSKTGEVPSDPASRKPGCAFPRETDLSGLPGPKENRTGDLDSWVSGRRAWGPGLLGPQ